LFQNLEQRLKKPPFVNYSKTYDQIVPYGELLSTTLMHHILTLSGIENQWHDMTTLLQTDSHYQQAAIDMKTSTQNIRKAVKDKTLNIFQGFIGGNREGFMTTLGREGSDYSAALVASMLKAKEVTVWKDVAGILNADPRYFDKPELLPHLSYDEAVELAYYGAKVIHPKTVRPLRDQHIRLHVRSFLNPQQPGTVIDQHAEPEHHQPCYIMKKNQCLMQCRTRDYTFITEAHLQRLYREFHELNIQVNMIQQAAIAVSVVMDADERRTEELEDRLSKWLDVTFTQGFDLATIRHYTATSIDHVVTNHKVVMQQTNGITAHLLMKQIS
jgi:aspartate kinase